MLVLLGMHACLRTQRHLGRNDKTGMLLLNTL